MGLGRKANWVSIIDFGLSKRYRDSRTSQHIAFRDGKQLTGTVRYSSINTHLGYGTLLCGSGSCMSVAHRGVRETEQSRRDDLESLGYVLVYLCRGSLPWQGIQAVSKKTKYDLISDKKMSTPLSVLCKNLPSTMRDC